MKMGGETALTCILNAATVERNHHPPQNPSCKSSSQRQVTQATDVITAFFANQVGIFTNENEFVLSCVNNYNIFHGLLLWTFNIGHAYCNSG